MPIPCMHLHVNRCQGLAKCHSKQIFFLHVSLSVKVEGHLAVGRVNVEVGGLGIEGGQDDVNTRN